MIAVLFEAQALPEAQQRYFELAAALKPLLADVPGLSTLSAFRALPRPREFSRSPGGKAKRRCGRGKAT